MLSLHSYFTTGTCTNAFDVLNKSSTHKCFSQFCVSAYSKSLFESPTNKYLSLEHNFSVSFLYHSFIISVSKSQISLVTLF
ncbi:hypothetical protein CW304_17035 [Bacillus sp. UFRGS-B20]|nr:hypothetical protein CW304_17035 [Bacillus sp. UFRGS-B20]